LPVPSSVFYHPHGISSHLDTITLNLTLAPAAAQWSFRKTGTTVMLASQAEIGVWVQSPGGRICEDPGVSSPENFEIVYAKSGNLVHFLAGNGSQCRQQCVLKHFINGNAMLPTPYIQLPRSTAGLREVQCPLAAMCC